jgi:SAM-dependent methyltransferase
VYEYGADFYRFLDSFAVRSARRIVSKLTAALKFDSVADFGCGQGAWLSVWAATGASVAGVDGPYIDRAHLLIDPSNYHVANLAEAIDLGRRFDLVQSLEVAEHLPAAKAGQFIDTLTAHGSHVLFSAAVPGQGGENHVNEQPLNYWRAIFRDRRFVAVDYLRPLISCDRSIARWYRCNTLLYVRDDMIEGLPAAVRQCRIPDGQILDDYWPPLYQMRHALVRQLPTSAVNCCAYLKAALAARRPARPLKAGQ